ncbi:MAG TPA: Uma2 family endonuclease [Gemmataceae bacterium]|nr:Uma2 family endonuclease [Gemmataceae bacterium]
MSTGTVQPVTYGLDASIAKFSVNRYQRMIETGILTAEDKVELLENYVVLKMPRNPPHDGTIQVISKRLGRRIPTGWDLRVQLSIVLPDSQPEPDFAICRGDETAYLTHHPAGTDVGHVVEVADTSLLRDQRDKTRIYARGGIPVYWIINLVDRRVEVYNQPSGPIAAPAYGAFQTFQPGDNVPLVLDGSAVGSVPVTDLLP